MPDDRTEATATLAFRLPRSQADRIRDIADRLGVSPSEYLRQCVDLVLGGRAALVPLDTDEPTLAGQPAEVR